MAEVLELPGEPKSIEDVLAGLTGFGLEENEEPLTVVASGKTVQLRLSNIPTEEEMFALTSVEELKGYMWVLRIKCEILSRAISWINGVNVRALTPAQRMVIDPTDGVQKDIQVTLRNIILGWGQELVGVLWKVLMVHCDRIEKRLQDNFPDSALMTDTEKRFMDQAIKEIEEAAQATIQNTVEELFTEELPKKEEGKA